MAKTFQANRMTRLGAVIVRGLVRAGLPLGQIRLLSVKGRKSGRLRTVPVAMIEYNSTRWLVAPFGEVNWVHNLRAAGKAQLSNGRCIETITVSEVSTSEAAPILKHYLRQIPMVKPYFDVTTESPLADFERAALYHPVFRIMTSASIDS